MVVLSALCLLLLVAVPAWAGSFGFAQVVAKARELAQRPYRAPPAVPDVLTGLSYDQYKDITFRNADQLWPDRRFHVRFYMPGLFFHHSVKINVIADGRVHEVPFSTTLFDFGTNTFDTGKLPSNLGFAGFNIRYTGYHPERTRAKTNKLISVLGASYFRVKSAAGQVGVSARGLAIDTTTAQPEEFPDFVEFWLKKPAPEADQITFYALLDSPSVAGAYRFVVKPGKTAVTDIKATLFLRKPVAQIGLAPLSSMYMYGIGDYRPPAYLRPAVHDSQGLLIHTADAKWIWRPLANPKSPSTYTFKLKDPRGFGLMQRNRDPLAYQSMSMAYGIRPSAWIEPHGDWGAGHVVLYEFSSPNETNDNIVAFWQPATRAQPGTPIHIAYSIHWGEQKPERDVGRVVDTLMTRHDMRHPTWFILDFAHGKLGQLPADSVVRGHISVGDNGKLVAHRIVRNAHVDGWRLLFKVAPVDGKPVQLRAYLSHDGQAVTETWDYVLAPTMP